MKTVSLSGRPTPPPSPRYELDMSKPYDYMVARMLLTIANKNEGCELTNVEHASGEVRTNLV